MILRAALVVALAALLSASPARADCFTGSSNEDGDDLNLLLAAGVGGLVGAGVGFGAGYGTWTLTGTNAEAQEWFTQSGLILGAVGGLVGGIYVHTLLEDAERRCERTADAE